MLVFGHRGAAGYVRENTIASFRTALELGVDGIEFDVRATSDHVPVVIHDETLLRTTGLSGTVSELTWDELSGLFVETSVAVPRLRDVMQLLGGRVVVNVEIKEARAVAATCEQLQRCVASGTALEQILVTSFDRSAIREFHSQCKEIPIGLLTEGLPDDEYWELASNLRAVSANIDVAAVNCDFVRQAQKLGLRTMVYTVNSPADSARMRSLGVDAIFSDYPDRVRG